MSVTGWLLICTGAGHGAFVVAGHFATPAGDQRAVRDAMAGASIDVAGLERTYWQLFQGFSLLMALMLVGCGALVLLVIRVEAKAVSRSGALPVLSALVLTPALVISAVLLPLVPIILLGLALVATVTALASGERRRTPDASVELGLAQDLQS